MTMTAPPTSRPSGPERTPPRDGSQTRGRSSWLPFIGVTLAILAATVAGLLALTSTLATKSFEFFEIKTDHAELQRQHQELTKEVAELESLSRLEDAARESGLVPSGTPGYVRLADGSVGGTPTRATPPPVVPPWGDHPGYPVPVEEDAEGADGEAATGDAGAEPGAASADPQSDAASPSTDAPSTDASSASAAEGTG